MLRLVRWVFTSHRSTLSAPHRCAYFDDVESTPQGDWPAARLSAVICRRRTEPRSIRRTVSGSDVRAAGVAVGPPTTGPCWLGEQRVTCRRRRCFYRSYDGRRDDCANWRLETRRDVGMTGLPLQLTNRLRRHTVEASQLNEPFTGLVLRCSPAAVVSTTWNVVFFTSPQSLSALLSDWA